MASIYYPLWGKTYRIVVYRHPKKNAKNQTKDGFVQGQYRYQGIITNDWHMPSPQVITFYNARGAEERVFDVLNNDFNWKHMPFSFLEENTVFMIVTAICLHLFTYLKQRLAKMFSFVELSFRLKTFIVGFVIVPARWVKSGRKWYLQLFTHKDYEKFQC